MTHLSRNHRSRQRDLFLRPLTTRDELHAWVQLFCNLNLPRTSVCASHDAPFEYLCRSYFEPGKDQIVHAPRGGGKTRLAALATLLDLVHKPGLSVRILAGSLEQSLKMWEHLLPDLERGPKELLERRIGSAKMIKLTTGASVAVLAQSERAVRGLRVQKLRCDEVELFKPEVWEAAQLVTRSIARKPFVQSPGIAMPGLSGRSPDPGIISGAIDALSTLHTPHGLMQQILDSAHATGTRVTKWCMLDVLETCEPDRECNRCPLWDDCKGRAKSHAAGYFKIDDAIAMKKRVSRECWEAEMLCRRPSMRGAVFPRFDADVHVREDVGIRGQLTLAMDFGFAAPLVCLWIVVGSDGRSHVIDEYLQPGQTMDVHLDHIAARRHGCVAWLACDPAGASRNDQTAASNVQLLRRAGYSVRHRKSGILEGVELVRTALSPAAGEPRLFIHPRCVKLIRAMTAYRYPEQGGELPLKDGEHDHPIDALRYSFVNRDRAPDRVSRY